VSARVRSLGQHNVARRQQGEAKPTEKLQDVRKRQERAQHACVHRPDKHCNPVCLSDNLTVEKKKQSRKQKTIEEQLQINLLKNSRFHFIGGPFFVS
jgi:hypothetical protein